MRRSVRIFLLLANLGIASAFCSNNVISVSDLRCESTTNPLGIEAPKPVLSWLLASSERGQKQTAYRILVASDERTLRNDQGDIWDSGKVNSDLSTQVPYAGPALQSDRKS